MKLLFWSGDNRWRGYKATTILATCAVVNELLDNYWIFSATPLTDNGGSQIASKFFYLMAQLAVSGTLFGTIGLGVDYLRSMYQEENIKSESDTLLRPS